MRQITRLLMVLLLSLMAVSNLHAQGSPPLIIMMEGQLYTWADGSLTPFTACHTTPERIISPVSNSADGTQIAYLTQPPIVAQAMEAFGGSIGGVVAFDNLWRCDITTGTAGLIAGQPPNASFMVEGAPDVGIAHSDPVWSPDGTRMAWTELRYPGAELALVVYNIENGASTAFPLAVPENPMGMPAPLMVMWGETGIMVWSIALNEETFILEENVLIYDDAGNLLQTLTLDPGQGEEDFIYERVLLEDNGKEYIGLLYIDSGWQLVDPETGVAQPMGGLAELYDPANPGGASLLFSLDDQFNYYWQYATADGLYTDPTGQPLAIYNFSRSAIALSPAGALAFTVFDGAYIFSEGESQFLPGTEPTMSGLHSLTWGGTAWRVRRDVQAAAAPPVEATAPTTCPGTQTSRLIVGQDGRVAEPTVPNNLRATPSANGELIGQIPGGQQFSVMDGPVCADGFAWWQVNFNGIVGWTVEGSANDYFLEPLP